MWFVIMMWACTGGQPEPAKTPESEPSPFADVLTKADAADGSVDHVVTKCAGCGLGMDGNPLHAVEHDAYELHFCSESCSTNFTEAPEAVLGRLAK